MLGAYYEIVRLIVKEDTVLPINFVYEFLVFSELYRLIIVHAMSTVALFNSWICALPHRYLALPPNSKRKSKTSPMFMMIWVPKLSHHFLLRVVL